MSKLLFISLSCLLSLSMEAQVTHSMSFLVGVNNSFYHSDIASSKSYPSFCTGTTAIDYAKHSDNIFWGGAGVGYSYRRIPIHIFEDGQKIGMEAAEFWLRARAGLKFEREFLTHLPFISLGLAKDVNFSVFSKNGQGAYSYTSFSDSTFNTQAVLPFIEIGNKLINSTFTEDIRDVTYTFSLRYYPLSLFKSPKYFDISYLDSKAIQYHLIEFCITAGIQHNVH